MKHILLIILAQFISIQKVNSQSLLLLHKKMQEKSLQNKYKLGKTKRNNKDALIFDLKGHVAKCVETHKTNSDDLWSNLLDGEYTYEFTAFGAYVISDYENYVPVRDSNGFLISASYTEKDIINNRKYTKSVYYEYSDDKLIREYGKDCIDGNMDNYEYKYLYDKDGNLIKMITKTETTTADTIIYEIQAVDSRGNWIRRKEVTQHGNGEISTAIATRKITYYDDIIIEEIPSDAPNFGLG